MRQLKFYYPALFLLLPILVLAVFTACNNQDDNTTLTAGTTEEAQMSEADMIKRGDYLVTIGGCHDCHSPKKFSAHGMSLDSSKLLSGHPEGSPFPPIDKKALEPGNWVLLYPDITAFVGPWGISYAANLTSDTATGIGNLTETAFISALRTGKHKGVAEGRPIMPPMPWEFVGKMTDEDIKSVYAFLRSIPAVKNRVPDPVPPPQVAAMK